MRPLAFGFRTPAAQDHPAADRRPLGLRVYARCHLAAMVVGVIASFIAQAAVQLVQEPGHASGLPIPSFAPGFVLDMLLFNLVNGLLIDLALWLVLNLRGGVLARWLFVALVGLHALTLPGELARYDGVSRLVQGLSVADLALRLVAAWALVRGGRWGRPAPTSHGAEGLAPPPVPALGMNP
ncbi:hypothetical protein GTZ99_10520 [Novosphingobium sp. FSY-8]|uniref:Uncharacterized protein n=1 Tax=Novosphingobium ovatum TaxID=1908523 RepID=A0ABW9XEM6_9SPHN|nr:hypothetical protein [Novosphingobium ovatum]NBC36989.1 hypothetical protein [Novosphingobium ovatum]